MVTAVSAREVDIFIGGCEMPKDERDLLEVLEFEL
jgi:hypothetical protein